MFSKMSFKISLCPNERRKSHRFGIKCVGANDESIYIFRYQQKQRVIDSFETLSHNAKIMCIFLISLLAVDIAGDLQYKCC